MIPLENMTVGDLIRHTARLYGNHQAVWYDNKTWNYAQLDEITDRMAQGFTALGIRKGDHVGIWADTEPGVIFVFYALQKMGAIVVMINSSLEREELADTLRTADVMYLCVGRASGKDRNLLGICESLPKLPVLKEIISISPVENLISAERSMAVEVSPQDTAVILFSSGSTGNPKAVMSSHYSRVNSGIQQAYDLGADCSDKFCLTMPMFHCFCISANLMAAMAVGACLCIPNDRRTSSILQVIEKTGCTILNFTPTMYRALIRNTNFQPEKTISLRTGIIGGAPYLTEEFVQIEKQLGFRLLSSLGQTECTAGFTVCGMDDPIELRSRTVGRLMSHVEGKIVDLETGLALSEGQRGEICVRGYVVMQGYYRQPELTAEVIDRDGWLHTGDLGILDEDGYISLAGRIKELINRGGEKISPGEIETVLSRLPQIKYCKALGVPDPHYGEEICVCIQLADGYVPDHQLVTEYLAKHLAYYKVPRYILFWEEFPFAPSGKIDLVQTKKMAKRELMLS